jgi:hypothetical protein
MDVLSRIKLASPARPLCVELSAVWLAFHDVAGVACTAQHAVDTDGEDLTCTSGLASLRSVLIFVRGGVEGTLALECVARIVARFKGEMRIRELRVHLSGPDATPYVAAERMRGLLGAETELTTSCVRASFRSGELDVVVERGTEPGPRFAFDAFDAVLSLDGTPSDAAALFRVRGETLEYGDGRSASLVAVTPERLLSDPAVRVAMMDRAWRDAAEARVPCEPHAVRGEVSRCFVSAAACVGARARGELLRAARARPDAYDARDEDLALASARLAIAMVHTSAALLTDAGERARVEPALAVLLEGAHALSAAAMLRAAFAALEGVPTSAGLGAVLSELDPPPANAAELVCVLFALYMSRLRTVRDAESRLGLRVLRVDVHVARSGTRLGAECLVSTT